MAVSRHPREFVEPRRCTTNDALSGNDGANGEKSYDGGKRRGESSFRDTYRRVPSSTHESFDFSRIVNTASRIRRHEGEDDRIWGF